MSDPIEVLRRLKDWICSAGTECDGQYEPPTAADAVNAIDAVLAEREQLRAEAEKWRTAALEQSQYVQQNWLSPIEAAGLRAHVAELQLEVAVVERQRDEIMSLQARVAELEGALLEIRRLTKSASDVFLLRLSSVAAAALYSEEGR